MKKLTALVVIGAILMTLHLAAAIPVLDNANGGTWKEYIHIPITAPTSTTAQYLIKINGTNISVYNSTGALKVTGICPSFWETVTATGDDIRVTNQSSELYFWIQEFNYTKQTATIWVNVTSGSTELDIYYGNALALPSQYNNASRVFMFYDDFTKGLVGTWAQVTGTWTDTVGKGLYVTTDYGTAPGNIILYTGRTFASGNYVCYVYGTLGDTDYSMTFNAQGTTASSLFNVGGLDNVNKRAYIFQWSGAAWTVISTNSLTATVATGDNVLVKEWQIGTTAYIMLKDLTTGTSIQDSGAVAYSGGYIGIHQGALFTTASVYKLLFVANLTDPATFETPTTQTVGNPTPGTIYINATYNAYDITGRLLINNSTALLTPVFVYAPSTTSSTGYLGTGSLTVPGLANITIYLYENYTLNTVVCNGTVVTPNYLGTTTINGLNFSVYNFTSPSAGLLVVTANVTPITSSGSEPTIYLYDVPTLNITSDIALVNVNTTYGATIKVSVEQPLNLSYLIFNGTELPIPAPETVVINGKNYSQYTVTVYNSSSLHVVATTPNLALATKIYADNNTTFSYVLVGEPFKVISPVLCNITLEGVTHTNTKTVTYTPMTTNPIVGIIKIFNLTTLQFGYHTFSYPVVWGHVNLTITPPIPVTLGVYSLTYLKVCGINTLYAGNDKITAYYMGMPVGQATFYLNHTNNGMNITISVNATSVSSKCYNITAVSPAKFEIYNLSSIPYGRFAVNHSDEVIITFENNSPVTVTVTGSTYSYYPPHLYIYGSGNATVTSYYRIKMNAESAVGLPMNVSVVINGKKVYVYGMTTKVMPVDRYEIHFPANVLGFVLKNCTLTNTTVVLTNSTSLPTAVYKVPTHISLEAYKINTTSFKFPFLPIPIPLGKVSTKQTNGTIACVEGTLYSWYGVPVPDANVTINITSLKTGYTVTRIVNTGSTGTFSVNFSVLPGVNYSITASFNGTPVYVGSEKKIVVAGGTLPPAPTEEHGMNAVIIAGVITVVGAGIFAVAYIIRKRSTTMAIKRLERTGRYFKRVKR